MCGSSSCRVWRTSLLKGLWGAMGRLGVKEFPELTLQLKSSCGGGCVIIICFLLLLPFLLWMNPACCSSVSTGDISMDWGLGYSIREHPSCAAGLAWLLLHPEPGHCRDRLSQKEASMKGLPLGPGPSIYRERQKSSGPCPLFGAEA